MALNGHQYLHKKIVGLFFSGQFELAQKPKSNLPLQLGWLVPSELDCAVWSNGVIISGERAGSPLIEPSAN